MQFLANYLERLLCVLYDIALRRHRDLPWILWLFLICCYKFADWLGLFVLGLSICGVGVCSMRQGKAIHHRLISSKTETHSLHPAAYRCTCSKGYSDLTNCPNLQNQICADMMIWNYKCILFPHETYSYAEAYYCTYSIATHISSELRAVREPVKNVLADFAR